MHKQNKLHWQIKITVVKFFMHVWVHSSWRWSARDWERQLRVSGSVGQLVITQSSNSLLINLFTDQLINLLLFDCLIDCFIHWFIHLIDQTIWWSMDWSVNQSIDCLTDWLIDQSSEWVSEWVSEWLGVAGWLDIKWADCRIEFFV